MRKYNRSKWYQYVPGGGDDGIKGWLEALYYNYANFRIKCPLLTLTSIGWWQMVYLDAFPEGNPYGKFRVTPYEPFRTCSCGRTWFRYRLLPALVGGRRLGGGC